MFELFKDEIPSLDKLSVVIRQMILDKKYSLEEIRKNVVDHISEHKGISSQDYDKMGEASSTACDVIDNLIDDLQVDKTNFKRIRDYIASYHSYNGFNRIISDFDSYMTDEERKRLIEEGKKIFVPEITEHWM